MSEVLGEDDLYGAFNGGVRPLDAHLKDGRLFTELLEEQGVAESRASVLTGLPETSGGGVGVRRHDGFPARPLQDLELPVGWRDGLSRRFTLL